MAQNQPRRPPTDKKAAKPTTPTSLTTLQSVRRGVELVPFDFNVGTQALPAGQYTLDRGPAPRTMMIRSDDGRRAAIVLTQPMSSVVARHAGKLVFHRYGSTYFLSEVWSPDNDGQKLPTTNRERELAAMRTTPVHATIAAAR